MEALPDLMSYEEALDFLREKEAIGSPLTTAEWAQVPAEVRRRAFFSATLTSARVAEKMQGYIDEFLDQHKEDFGTDAEHFSAQGRSEFVIKMRELLEKEGFGKVLPDGTIDPEINDNDLRDLRSARRLQLIFDTHVEQACSYGQWLEGQDPDVLDIFPAQRFIRVRPVLAPRAYHEEALDTVRRKDDSKFWIGLNRDFGLPYGPWGFNSGCGVEDVDRDEAEELGVIKPDETPKPQTQHFNEKHQQSTAGLSDDVKLWAEKQLEGVATFKGDKATMLPLASKVELPEQAGDDDFKTPKFIHRFLDVLIKPIKKIKQFPAVKQRLVDGIALRQKKYAEGMLQCDKERKKIDAKYNLQEAEITKKYLHAEENYKKNPSEDNLKPLEKWEKEWYNLLDKKQYELAKIDNRKNDLQNKIYDESLKFLELEGLVVPKDKRGIIRTNSVKIDEKKVTPIYPAKPLPNNAKKGLELLQAIVPDELLPSFLGVDVVTNYPNFRSFCSFSHVKITDTESPAEVAHEAAHAIEALHPEVRKKCLAFLCKRGWGTPIKSLNELTNTNNYEDEERAFEDEWVNKKGVHYCGKIYLDKDLDNMSEEEFVKSATGTEILAMGVQRFFEAPIQFMQDDSEYYEFIKSILLQK